MEDTNTRACGNENTHNSFFDDLRFPTFTNSLLYHDDYGLQVPPNCNSDEKLGHQQWYTATMVDTHNPLEAVLVMPEDLEKMPRTLNPE